jgi:hypothetical protein
LPVQPLTSTVALPVLSIMISTDSMITSKE